MSISNQNTLFEIKNVGFTYSGNPPVEALKHIDLEISAGEYIAIIGANGSGKSTIARLLNGLLLPVRGEVKVAGIPTTHITKHKDIRKIVQMVFQQPDYQIVANTVEEDVAFGPENYGVELDALKQRVASALEIVGMNEYRMRSPSMLSAGQKQRVAIAGALAIEPDAIILDEATSMLDPVGRLELLTVLSELHKEGKTIITITHEMEEAARADRVIVMHRGEIKLDGTPREIFSQPHALREIDLDVPWIVDLSTGLGLPVCLSEKEFISELEKAPVPQISLDQKKLFESLQGNTFSSVSDPIIETEKLHHTYMENTPLAVEALQDVSISIQRNQITGMIGPTGSGKSTLLQHFNGILRPQAGNVIVDGQVITDKTDVSGIRQKVGLLFQQAEDQLFEYYVGDDIAYGPLQMNLSREEVRERVRKSMEIVGLPFDTYKDRVTTSLSGGEQRLAALAGVLANQPVALCLDEPTAGLDPAGRKIVYDILRKLVLDGVSIVLSSHRFEDIACLCISTVEMHSGKIRQADSTRNILSDTENNFNGKVLLPVARLAKNLRNAGWPIPEKIIHADELLKVLQQIRLSSQSNDIRNN